MFVSVLELALWVYSTFPTGLWSQALILSQCPVIISSTALHLLILKSDLSQRKNRFISDTALQSISISAKICPKLEQPISSHCTT